MIISIQLPKTAGSSFKASLEKHFAEKFLPDYADLPINTPPIERHRHVFESGLIINERDYREVECIHGHFMPAKYLLLNTIRPLTFVTWMRHPVERIISHYYFWQRRYWPEAPPLHKRIVEEQWSLERFCLSQEMKNLYNQFLWGFPLHYFDFIGITENYDEDFRYFSQNVLNSKIPMFKENVNENRKGTYPIDKSLRKKIESFHEQDMELYHTALKMRWKRNHPKLFRAFGYFH